VDVEDGNGRPYPSVGGYMGQGREKTGLSQKKREKKKCPLSQYNVLDRLSSGHAKRNQRNHGGGKRTKEGKQAKGLRVKTDRQR